VTWQITRNRRNAGGSNEVYKPALLNERPYQVFKRYAGDEKEKSSGAKCLRSLDAVVTHLEQGYSLWMRGEDTKQRNLISPKSIKVRKI